MTRAAPAALAILLQACSFGPRPKVVHLAPPPVEVAEAAPLPVKLGLHASPEVNATWWANSIGGPVIKVGEATLAILRPALVRQLGPVTDVAAPPPFDQATTDADLVLVPTVADFSTFSAWGRPEAWHAVTLRLALFDRAGHLVSSWTVRASEPVVQPPRPAPVTADPQAPEPEAPAPDGVAQAGLNLAVAAQRLALAIRTDPRLEAWLASQAAGGAAGGGGGLDGLEVEAALEDRPIDYPGTKPTLLENGFVPVRVRLVNRGPAPVRLDGLHAQLRLADGRVVQRIGPAMAVERLSMSSSYARVRTIGSFGALVGGLAANVDLFKERTALPVTRALLEEMVLEPGEVASGAAQEGVLLFLPQSGGPAGQQATLELWAADLERRHLRVTRPLRLPPPPQAVEVRASQEE